MKTIRLVVATFLFVAMIGILVPSATADDMDKETRFTCSEPVLVAGVVLQPGTYWFKLEDVTSSRNLVVIRNQDRTRIVARVYAISNYRAIPDDRSTFEYWDKTSGKPLALRNWFYPGDVVGFEFAQNR